MPTYSCLSQHRKYDEEVNLPVVFARVHSLAFLVIPHRLRSEHVHAGPCMGTETTLNTHSFVTTEKWAHVYVIFLTGADFKNTNLPYLQRVTSHCMLCTSYIQYTCALYSVVFIVCATVRWPVNKLRHCVQQ